MKRNLKSAALFVFGLIAATNTFAQQGDLSLLQLKGNVNTCVWTEDRGLFYPIYDDPYDGVVEPTTYKFTKAGKLSTINGTNAFGDGGGSSYFNFHERNREGRIKSVSSQFSIYTPMSSYGEWTYNADGLVAKQIHNDPNATITSTYTYDTQGRVSAVSVRFEFDFSDYDAESIREMGLDKLKNHTLKVTYSYLSTDTHGNWTKRKATTSQGKTWTETRVITYYNSGTASEKVYDAVNGTKPSFPGGIQALRQYLAQNLKYPILAVENKVEGKVLVQFVVMKDGSISNVSVAQSVDSSLDKEAVRVVQSMPKWSPGTHNGKAVNVKYTLPISFKLSSKATTKTAVTTKTGETGAGTKSSVTTKRTSGTTTTTKYSTTTTGYTDRTALNLNGPVKSVMSDAGYLFDSMLPYSSLTFTRAGKVATWEGVDFSEIEDEKFIKRNSKGQIISFEYFGLGFYYTYNVQGKITSFDVYTIDKGMRTNDGTIYCTYDSDGNLIKLVGKDIKDGKNDKIVYTILKKDRYGNWTRREETIGQGKTSTETRVITYYQ